MEQKFIIATFDIYCDWSGEPPIYRVYVNDELFSERAYIWQDSYLTETLQISAEPGKYPVRVEYLNDDNCNFKIQNRNVSFGPGAWLDNNTIEVYNES